MSVLALALIVQAVAADDRPLFTLPCMYESRTIGEVESAPDCAALDADGRLQLAPARFADLVFDPCTGLAPVKVDTWHYFHRDGRSAPVTTFENWAADFDDGRAPSPRGARIGYIDPQLRLAIPARFDGAYRFQNGRATVCFGCMLASDGEHSWYTGGRWACIDTAGREISRRACG